MGMLSKLSAMRIASIVRNSRGSVSSIRSFARAPAIQSKAYTELSSDSGLFILTALPSAIGRASVARSALFPR